MNDVVLGWLLGVLSTPLTLYFTGAVEKRRFACALREELSEVRYRLAALIYSLRNHMGLMDRTALEWQHAELMAYPQGEERDRLLQGIRRLIDLTDAQLAALAQNSRDPLGSKALPKIITPYLSAKLDTIGLLSAKKQKELVNFLHYIEVINLKVVEMAE